MIELAVTLSDASYPIHIGERVWQQHDLAAPARGKQALVVTNETVAAHYLEAVCAKLGALQLSVCVLPDGEQYKTLASAEKVFAALCEMRANRDATIYALGGGVIGDLAGFCASVWMRGIPFVQLPTTLLAMVDSSVGGKTAVNLPAGKNLVGAFWQPQAVYIDTTTLHTLPERELRAGLAEVVKYGAIADLPFFEWLEQHVDSLLQREPSAIAEAIARSCAHKAAIVGRDERENGERALLNFGHTFGHAYETFGAYSRYLHGEAVAIGMVSAARLSATLGLSPLADHDRLKALLSRFGLPTDPPADLSTEQLLSLMALDKKNRSSDLRLILWTGIGAAMQRSCPASEIAGALSTG